MTQSIKGAWSTEQIEQFLVKKAYPVRLGCIGDDGFPRVVSVWYQYVDGQLLCVSHRSSKLVALLRKNGKVGFEVSPNMPPYCGVRGQGLASLSGEGAGEALAQLLERYLGGKESSLGNWLLSRREDEVLISIAPVRMFSWDYRERMDKWS